MRKMLLILALSISTTACLGTTAPAPPQLPVAVTNISRGAIDFALNSFDAALYGLDFMVAAGKLTPGSEKAKSIASAGRAVQSALKGAEAARKAGNSASYEAAFAKANEALSHFRSLLGGPSASVGTMPALSPAERADILNRLDA